MPTVNGVMYGEARQKVPSLNKLNVLVLGDIGQELKEFAVLVDTLHVYLNDTLQKDIELKLHCTSAVSAHVAEGLSIHRDRTAPLTEEALIELVCRLDVDVVLDQNALFVDAVAQKNFYTFLIVKNLDELKNSCEDFLVGNDVPWLFSEIIWNMPLLMRYVSRPGVCKDFFDFMGECRSRKGYSIEQQDRLRYLANRLCQIEYSKDIIQYYIKRMRKAGRNGYSYEDFNFELNYHLSNYYFLMAGSIDSVARLINNIYKLKLPRRSLEVRDPAFIAANRRKRTGLLRLLTKKTFIDWMSFLKERRNFIAHEGDMRQSPLVVKKDITLTDIEVDKIVDQQTDWSFLATILTPDQIKAWRAQAAQTVRIKHDFKIVAKNVMMVPDSNGGHRLYHPLISVDYDYEKLSDFMQKMLEKLKR